ncbi:MAG: glycosyltransferase involved in cell wall biosynthesis [Paraglaciecola sp.]|jgi:glycosyltransferase involved in cell wall biosynthesis
MYPLVSVIIPVWNDQDKIKLCLDALKKQSIGNSKLEVIVVDNASTDNTAKVLEDFDWIQVLYEPTPGSYVARNTALKVAKGKYLAFTDSDCVPDSNWLEKCLICAEQQPDFGVIAGEVRFFQPIGKSVEQSADDYETLFSMNQKINSKNGVSITANFFSKNSVVQKYGGFNSNLKSGGDHELSKKISDDGKPIVFCKEAFVLHPSRNIKELLVKRRRVIGGSWDRQLVNGSTVNFFWLATKLFIKRTILATINQKLDLHRKCALVSLLLKIFIVSCSEIIRLKKGGDSVRS